MPLPTVWPEHPEVAGVIGEHDCTQCAACMVLIFAGFTAFPLGAYTVAERNALDAADDRPDNTGATLDGSIKTAGWLDRQVANRYGVTMHRLPDDSEATLRRFLTTPGYGFLLQGSMGNLPASHVLRRWQPEFGGGHAVCVISGTQPRWLDPLAPKNFAGDLTDADTVLRFAWDGAQYSRYLAKDELATLPDTSTEDDVLYIREIRYPAPRVIRTLPVTKDVPKILAYAPPNHTVVRYSSQTSNSWFNAAGEARVKGWNPKNPDDEWEYWIAADGYFAGLYVAKSALTKADPVPTAPSQADYTAAINEAVKPYADALNQANARITGIRASAEPVPVPK